jgi:drug/metabolite transporter (DMT)-like permease
VLGVVLQAAFFVMYLTLLSRADVSKILPLTAFDYIVMAILAQYLLAEPVTPGRWAGIGLIVAGVYLVSRT